MIHIHCKNDKNLELQLHTKQKKQEAEKISTEKPWAKLDVQTKNVFLQRT